MKKVFLILVFLGLAFSYGFSQTYYYKAVADINANGVKSSPKGKGMYITFTNQESICYDSDENGYRSNNTGFSGESFEVTYHYQKTHNGTHVYQGKYSTALINIWQNSYYYFCSDFNKMQSYYSQYGYTSTTEYIRTNGPEDEYKDNIPTF